MEKYTLIGVDGNAYAIMAYVSECMRREGMSREEIEEYKERAKDGDYDHLLIEFLDMVEMLNEKYEDYDD